MSGKTAKLTLPDGTEHTLPVVIGSEAEPALDIRALRQNTGYVTLDSGYMNIMQSISNTGSFSNYLHNSSIFGTLLISSNSVNT